MNVILHMAAIVMQFAITRLVHIVVNVRMVSQGMVSIVQVNKLYVSVFDCRNPKYFESRSLGF